MIFFEQELRKIAANSEYLRHAKYVGRDCVARLNPDVTAKLSFVTCGIANHYEALCIQLINRREGQIDRQIVNFRDLWGEYSLYGIMRSMYIWADGSKTDWYGLAPTAAQYRQLSKSVNEYLSAFAEPEMSEDMNMTM